MLHLLVSLQMSRFLLFSMKGLMMLTIAVTNQKGGVGKTTTTYHFARAASLRGLRVLVVDLDPQGYPRDRSVALGMLSSRRIGIGRILPPRARMPWRPCAMSS